jgi:hypothetical protein
LFPPAEFRVKTLHASGSERRAPDDLVRTLRDIGRVDGPNAVMKQLEEHLGGKPG